MSFGLALQMSRAARNPEVRYYARRTGKSLLQSQMDFRSLGTRFRDPGALMRAGISVYGTPNATIAHFGAGAAPQHRGAVTVLHEGVKRGLMAGIVFGAAFPAFAPLTWSVGMGIGLGVVGRIAPAGSYARRFAWGASIGASLYTGAKGAEFYFSPAGKAIRTGMRYYKAAQDLTSGGFWGVTGRVTRRVLLPVIRAEAAILRYFHTTVSPGFRAVPFGVTPHTTRAIGLAPF